MINNLIAYLTNFKTIIVEAINPIDIFNINFKIENGENKINIINKLVIQGNIQLELDKEINIKRQTTLIELDNAVTVNYTFFMAQLILMSFSIQMKHWVAVIIKNRQLSKYGLLLPLKLNYYYTKMESHKLMRILKYILCLKKMGYFQLH